MFSIYFHLEFSACFQSDQKWQFFAKKMLHILATFPPICKSFGLFFAKLLKCGLFLCQNSDFGIFLNFLATFGAQSGTSVFSYLDEKKEIAFTKSKFSQNGLHF